VVVRWRSAARAFNVANLLGDVMTNETISLFALIVVGAFIVATGGY